MLLRLRLDRPRFRSQALLGAAEQPLPLLAPRWQASELGSEGKLPLVRDLAVAEPIQRSGTRVLGGSLSLLPLQLAPLLKRCLAGERGPTIDAPSVPSLNAES
mmetsp:Transcript_76045/g.217844  ORF Transcript_76045/g.217844 Transcript_76045/m.217844 type:complete len:103 (+) Transcript_76045:1188-1496(+)